MDIRVILIYVAWIPSLICGVQLLSYGFVVMMSSIKTVTSDVAASVWIGDQSSC
jgi:hypothetical protein